LFWDGRVEVLDDGSFRAPVTLPAGLRSVLEAQALLPMLDRDEMRGQPGDVGSLGGANELAAFADDAPEAIWDAIMARLMAIPEYRELFATVFPTVPAGEHTIVHVARALARFEMRLWELTDTAFDQFLGAEHRAPVDDALGELQRRGAELFFGDAGCDRCHNGPLLSDFAFHNIGVPPIGPGKRDGIDEGRFLVTNDVADRFAFRTPPLRNVALTAPYMHDGAIATLDEALRHHVDPEGSLARGVVDRDGHVEPVDPALAYDIGATIDPDVKPLRTLSEDELHYLEAFLESLTSQTERDIFPGAGEPFAVPSGLPIDHADF
jgi:cytochrome c peroxidase